MLLALSCLSLTNNTTIPLTAKSEVFSTLSRLIDVESKRLGYYPSVLHSDRGTEFINAGMEDFCQKNVIRQRFSDEYSPQQNGLAERFNRTVIESLQTVMLDSGLRPNLWNEVLGSCTLALNQIPTHRSKQSPYELLKKKSIPIDFFKPIGNPVAVLSNQKKSKLEPRGDFGRLVGLNAELKSYWVRLDDGRFVNLKSVKFLDFSSEDNELPDYGELIVQQERETVTQPAISKENDEEDNGFNVKEEEPEEDASNDFQTAEEDTTGDEDDIIEQLIPSAEAPIPQPFMRR
ncbi:hypothetical protein VP01_2661g2 [Puccinia sorghi]|uniref:Integrase catalytic domain-containing protein n=1 Tax=Puccinia sorghi TaxID=27349 RepID=A0A0L6V438_9BASI|nr:hypothetical protein VP01_2661g2 [Puccinia sorghi]